MAAAADAARLPIVGEALRAADRRMLARGQTAAAPAVPAAAPEPPAPIVAVHGVGEFDLGDVVGAIAAAPAFAHRRPLGRDTVVERARRYTLLLDRAAGGRPRMAEVNWSDVRRAMPDLLGLLRHFVVLLVALDRVGARGAYRSRSVARPLATGWVTLWAVEGLLVWSAFAPALSALLWQLRPGERLATGALVAGAAVYAALQLRRLSWPMAGGGFAFAVLALWWGWWSCIAAGGHRHVAGDAAALHTWATLVAASAVLVAAVEILLRPAPPHARGEVRVVHRLARLACLWLPLVLMVVLQPLSVTLALLPMDEPARIAWGQAFAKHMPFDPVEGQVAAGWVAAALAGTLVIGALQFKSVQRFGRNTTVVIGWGSGAALLVLARGLEAYGFGGCALCRACLRPDWLAIAGLLLFSGASLTWVLFARSEVAIDRAGRAWYPAGSFARFWAGVMLAAVPIALTATLGWSWARVADHWNEEVLADASEVFLQSTKYALLLLPMATKPFAAFLDALGDVFFFLVRSPHLATRRDTLARVGTALRLVDGPHRIVFAHSQGTVLAAVLLSRLAASLRRGGGRLTLVTVGSPITTLYRNFLGATLGEGYAALCAAEPERFRWINLARPADYIGGAIELPGVENRDLLTDGDHVGYWDDAELVRWLAALAEGRAT